MRVNARVWCMRARLRVGVGVGVGVSVCGGDEEFDERRKGKTRLG